jgi:hypothetical protein
LESTSCGQLASPTVEDEFKGQAKARWFGAEISWFDEEKLGWRLGFEAAR